MPCGRRAEAGNCGCLGDWPGGIPLSPTPMPAGQPGGHRAEVSMIRVGVLLVLVGSMGFLSHPSVASAEVPKKAPAAVLAIQRGGGFVDPARSPLAYYWFTVAKNGAWEFKPLKGETKKGTLAPDDVNRWAKEIKDGGFDRLKS